MSEIRSWDRQRIRSNMLTIRARSRYRRSVKPVPAGAGCANLIYAPGFYTGYGVKTIPGVREAIEQKRWQEAAEQIERIGRTLTREAELIDEAASALGQ